MYVLFGSVLEMSIRWLLNTFGPNLITVLANCLTTMHVMITRVMPQNPALLSRGTTQSETIARVLTVEGLRKNDLRMTAIFVERITLVMRRTQISPVAISFLA